jgi:hypothetical protein
MKGHQMSYPVQTAAFCLVAMATLSGCGGEIGGSGELTTGEQLSVVQVVDVTPEGQTVTFDIASPDGWTCRSVFQETTAAQQQSVRRTYPLTCSNGAKGNIILTWDNVQLRQTGTFALDNGKSGSVLFDYLRR